MHRLCVERTAHVDARQAQRTAKGHEDQARQGADEAGDALNEKTQNKYQGQVDAAKQKLNEQLSHQPPRDEF
ncbi:antitoxin [Streptomyces sp. NBC_00268]|uniref:antitoxin n=1 Tax=unclassified Streptomyces TaxID=2593676 RepID=UPI002B1D8178|nr:antitoxin [Streptomyces sp. NBC_00268]